MGMRGAGHGHFDGSEGVPVTRANLAKERYPAAQPGLQRESGFTGTGAGYRGALIGDQVKPQLLDPAVVGTLEAGQFGVRGQFGVSASLLLSLHQVGKLDSWEDFQDRQAMTLFTTRSTAGTTEPMSSAPTANGICSLAISPAPRRGILSRSSATA